MCIDLLQHVTVLKTQFESRGKRKKKEKEKQLAQMFETNEKYHPTPVLYKPLYNKECSQMRYITLAE